MVVTLVETLLLAVEARAVAKEEARDLLSLEAPRAARRAKAADHLSLSPNLVDPRARVVLLSPAAPRARVVLLSLTVLRDPSLRDPATLLSAPREPRAASLLLIRATPSSTCHVHAQ
jgi:uncharacterized protein (DUF2236 family)